MAKSAAANSARNLFALHPVDVEAPRVIGSRFGARVDPIHGGKSFHRGQDYRVPTGTFCRSIGDGRVRYVATDPGAGLMLAIAGVGRFAGYEWRYLHLHHVDVVAGQDVATGQTVAESGNTGTRTTGPHLHFEIHHNGVAIDPLSVLPSTSEGIA